MRFDHNSHAEPPQVPPPGRLRVPPPRVYLPDRTTAGVLLARLLLQYRGMRPVVLGLARGGVPVAAAVARAINGDLDVAVARKLGAPGQVEFAIGAVTADGTRHLDSAMVRRLGVTAQYLERVATREQAEAQRREQRFRHGIPPIDVKDRVVILVDDGLATGATMLAAADAIRRQEPARVVVAVPVGSREACELMETVADDVVCLAEPEPFVAVGLHYRDFDQVGDEEVVRLLDAARAREDRDERES